MPYNYNSFKRITSAGIVDGTLQGSDFANSAITANELANGSITNSLIATNQVTGAKIADGNITSSSFATGAVDLTTSVVTGNLAVSVGGLGSITLASNRTLMVNDAGNALEMSRAGLISVNVFNTNGTWTKPAGCTRIRVQVVGGGGGGTGHGEAGGSGGYSERYMDVTSITSVSVTVGPAGFGANYHNEGGNGTASSFGTFATAGGGEGARKVGGHTGGRGGVGSGTGNVNLYGGGGAGHTHYGGGQGGRSFFGGPAIGVHAESPNTQSSEALAAPGAGGTGGAVARHTGAAGKNGIVVVYNFR